MQKVEVHFFQDLLAKDRRIGQDSFFPLKGELVFHQAELVNGSLLQAVLDQGLEIHNLLVVVQQINKLEQEFVGLYDVEN